MPDNVTTTETTAASTAAVPDAAALAAEIATLKAQVAESQRTAQYWAEKARTPAPAKTATAEEEEPDVLEAITTGGAKGFDALAKKRGFVQKSEVEALINERATSLTKEQELLQQFPDLKNKNSEFFKATALEYGDLVKSGVPMAKAMELAASTAELKFIREGKIKLPGAPEPAKAEKEAARLARIAAQGGDSSRRPAAAEEEDDELTPQQKHIAASMGISEEAYARRAKAGVAMKGTK